jgi:D-serine deaminase-like pyridoxal phosphate-dependent protein
VVRRNCKLMLDTARELGVGFRAHVKTHKVSF